MYNKNNLYLLAYMALHKHLPQVIKASSPCVEAAAHLRSTLHQWASDLRRPTANY